MTAARRVVLAVLVLLVLVPALPGRAAEGARAAAAAPCVYVPRCAPTIGLLAPTTAAGATQTVVGSGFVAGDHVTVTIRLADGSTIVLHVVADADGAFRVSFTVPDDLGVATVVAVGERSGRASAQMVVVPAVPSGTPTTPATAGPGGDSSGGGLAFTGVAVVGTGVLALLLVGGGAALLLLGRRPRRHDGRPDPST